VNENKTNLQDYTNRVKDLKQQLIQAQTKKDIKTEELNKLKSEYSELEKQCVNDFNCKPTELKSKILEAELQLNSLIESAENELEKLKESL
jgi:hypothetical protein